MDRKERKNTFIEICGLIKECGAIYQKMMNGEVDIKESVESLKSLETKGDVLQANLDQYFKNQNNIPYLSLDRAKLLARLDDVLDDFAVVGLSFHTYSDSLPDYFNDNSTEFVNLINQISGQLADAVTVMYDSFKEALEITEEIEVNRDRAREISFNMEAELFKLADDTKGWKGFLSVQEVIKKSMKVAESMKQASEILEIMALKYD